MDEVQSAWDAQWQQVFTAKLEGEGTRGRGAVLFSRRCLPRGASGGDLTPK